MMNQSPASNDRDRRGMLLLLVLNVLALFLVVGALGILVATRARDSARAFAAAQASQVNSPALARGLLDEALLTLIRGGSSANGVTESLLEDKYGSPALSGTLTAVSASGPLVTGTITGIPTANPASLNGRIVTLVPTGTDSTGPTSWRILRVDQGTTTYRLANVRPQTPAPLPAVPCDAVINGREFDGTGNNEPYDAFTASGTTTDPYLTNSGTLVNSRVQQVVQPAFGTVGQTCTVDNDGDGVADGIWLDGVLPSMRSPNGGQLTFSVSYLVLDLDSRINLNAHGSVVRAQAVLSSTTYPARPTSFVTAGTWALSGTIPLGMGYGTADIDASLLVAPQPDVVAGAIPLRYVTLLQGGTVTQNAVVSSSTQWRPTPRAETTQLGRYGGSVGPGNSTSTTGTMAANADYWMLNPTTGNSPTDLKARLQVFTEGSPPSLKFARPAPSWAVGDTDDIVGSGTTAHPYAMRLDEDAPRAAGGNATEAVYTVAELERILRPYDSDAAQLAPRLAAILDDYAEPSRMTVTTDSWDTPAITGSVVGTIVAGGTTGQSPDVAAGLRFNLNRPLTSGSARQDFFNQLRKLCETVSVPTAEAAQWAANVIDFRDPDSIMNWYPYGSGTGVWGMERPEVVITDATFNAMTGNLTVNLYRPWSAQLCSGSSTTATGTTEAIDNSLGNRAANTLTLTGSSGTNAIWQFMVSGTTTGTFVGGPVGIGSLISTATAVQTNTAVGPATITLTGTPGQVMLQRLANPAAPRDTNSMSSTYNDYVTVHRVSVPQGSRSVSRWLHWPNRDFISHGELLTVLSGTTADVPEAMFSATNESSVARAYRAILDATVVPSRFAGANVSVSNGATALAGTGYENFQYGQLSRWREPGRVNVNTILPNVGNSPSTLDNAVWNALVGGTSVPNPVTSGSYTPVQSLRTLLTGSTATTPGPFDRPSADPNSRSAFLQRATAIRLANCATTRSHVFAVWITLRITDSSPNAGPPQFARLFAIVDRSIPVGYSPGRNLNVRETIRLQRFVE